MQSGKLMIQIQNAKFAEVGRKASPRAGHFGLLVEMPSHLAVPGTDLQFRGHHSPDARRGQEICHR